MHVFEIIYVLSVLIGVGACVPQVVALWRKKAADEFSVPTWTLWLMTQTMSLTYAISINNAFIIAANICWLTFYMIMISLIVYYNRQAKPAEQLVPEAVSE